MRPVCLALLLALFLGRAAWPQDAAVLAQEASDALGQAAEALAEAETASDRIGALTRTIRAYESGLAAMREGLRRAALRERELAAGLTAQDAELGEMLVLLQNVTRRAGAETVFHPGGAQDSVRAGILAASLVPALKERSSALERDLGDLAALRAVQDAGIGVLEDGLEQVRAARLALARAVSDRTDLPPLAATDQAAMEALINSSETLAAFADSLAGDGAGKTPRADAGAWEMPVIGSVLRRFDEADAAGVRHPGWVVATAPEALVTAPAAATVRFAGEVPGSGLVVILEPAPGLLAILSGLGRSLVVRGQIVDTGEPVGLMGIGTAPAQEKLNETSLANGQSGGETLYIEIRQGQAPVDPAAFLRPTEE